ncbi:conserved hypothetical protein [Ricinus communis]|uniref:Uncharacterized protein n=1 Tax=Ricinus communis TaxID=3988 RepID=B9SAH8_RICCO|nr:conserved hypothetical protein [Ricinus communis]
MLVGLSGSVIFLMTPTAIFKDIWQLDLNYRNTVENFWCDSYRIEYSPHVSELISNSQHSAKCNDFNILLSSSLHPDQLQESLATLTNMLQGVLASSYAEVEPRPQMDLTVKKMPGIFWHIKVTWDGVL